MNPVPIADKTFCEFFAGIGLVREGLASSGWSCAFANDLDPKKQQLYEGRFGAEGHFHLGDVWDTDTVLGRITGRPFLATASFPCVDLSLAGHGRGFEGSHSSTFFGFVRVLESLAERRPKLVLLENVSGFVTSAGGRDFETAARLRNEIAALPTGSATGWPRSCSTPAGSCRRAARACSSSASATISTGRSPRGGPPRAGSPTPGRVGSSPPTGAFGRPSWSAG